MKLAPPRGTRDFYPEEMRLRNWLFDRFRTVSRRFAFEEYDAPLLEVEELYTRKSGEEIVAQLYTLTDKGGRRLALRPEMTPSLARLLLQRGRAQQLPVKWFSIPQCWRYERMTRGRRREHYQWNMDVIGVAGVSAEAELISALITLFEEVGLADDDVGIKVSSRKVLGAILEQAGVASRDFAAVCVAIDKLERAGRAQVEQELAGLGVTASAAARLFGALECKDIEEIAGQLGGSHGSVLELEELLGRVDDYGHRGWLQFDASVVRGLAYYTGVVFEAFDRKHKLRAICGGGRYDRLLSTFGGADLPACGFGFGDAVIMEVLKERDLLPQLSPGVDDVVVPHAAELRAPAAQVAARLRRSGRAVDLVLEDRRLKWAYRHADRIGARRVLLIAPEEWAKGLVRVKDLASGAEQDLPAADL